MSFSISCWHLINFPYFADNTERGDSGWKEAQRQGGFMDKFNVFSVFLPILTHKYENETIQGEMILGQPTRPFIIVEECIMYMETDRVFKLGLEVLWIFKNCIKMRTARLENWRNWAQTLTRRTYKTFLNVKTIVGWLLEPATDPQELSSVFRRFMITVLKIWKKLNNHIFNCWLVHARSPILWDFWTPTELIFDFTFITTSVRNRSHT